jgi:hypothetical protein
MRKKHFFSIYSLLLMGIFLVFASGCEKEIKESIESGTVSSSFKSKWVRSDENTGMYIDLTGDYPIFCSSSDWTKFDFSKIVGVNPNTIQFTITNPATGGYYTLRCIKTSETEMELITHESSYANDFTGGYYTKTNEWCEEVDIPFLQTKDVIEITQTSAKSGGDVYGEGSSTVTARGVCWSTSPYPNVELSEKTVNGTGTGSFTSNIAGLTENTTYFLRAYATNSFGTAYGIQRSFTTNGDSHNTGTPVLTTNAITEITQTSAKSGGNITSSGNASITARGVCWSTSLNPTINDSKTSDGTVTGTYTSSITGLSANTTYYVRAYATSNNGTAYGSELSFKTAGSTNLSLDGIWYLGDTEITISGTSGKFSKVSGNWQNALNNGIIAIGDLKIRNIKSVSNLNWTCDDLWHRAIAGDVVEVFWSYEGTITMSSDGNKITVSSKATYEGKSLAGNSTYTRK